MAKFDVIRYGTDSSGRPIYMTRFMKDWLDDVLNDKAVRDFADLVTIVQGAFMSRVPGGGADASAGYHDYAGCLDFRTWNLTGDQQGRLIRAMRRHGAAAWIRDEQHGGFDAHIHVVVGGDYPLSSGASYQWSDYKAGGDGMGGDDYHWRPETIRPHQWNPKPKAPKINLTHLLSAYNRPRGATYNKWGKKACRQWCHRLRVNGIRVKGYKWKQGYFGNTLKAGTKRANKKYDIERFTGKDGDRPSFKLAKKLGFAPYKTGKPKKKFIRSFTK